MNTGHDQLASSTSYYANEDGSKDFTHAVTCTCGVSVTVSFTTAEDSATPPPSGITDALALAVNTALVDHIESNTDAPDPVDAWSSSDPDELRKELEYENKPVSLAYLCESLEWPSSRVKRAWHDLVVAGPAERYEIVRASSGEGVSYGIVR